MISRVFSHPGPDGVVVDPSRSCDLVADFGGRGLELVDVLLDHTKLAGSRRVCAGTVHGYDGTKARVTLQSRMHNL